jgi:metal-dependent amidase/aminoacylase/carboxypeptidase family protein
VAPETGVNALDACVSAYQNVAQLRQHISAIERVHGVITFGGDAPNIVPDRAEALYYLRAADARALEALRLRVAACLEAGALGAGATIELDWWTHPCLDLRSNDPLTKAYRANAESLGRWFFEMAAIPPGVAGSTDMGNISYAVPSIHPCIGVDSGGIGTHSHEFVACAASEGGDRAVLDGAKSLAMTAVDYLHRPELQEAVSKRFVPGPRR